MRVLLPFTGPQFRERHYLYITGLRLACVGKRVLILPWINDFRAGWLVRAWSYVVVRSATPRQKTKNRNYVLYFHHFNSALQIHIMAICP